jgi:hypothetical protein
MDYSAKKEYTYESPGAGGLNLVRKPWELDEDEWQAAQNVQFVAGAVQRARGFASFGVPAAGVRVAGGWPFRRDSTTQHGFIVITNKRLYK